MADAAQPRSRLKNILGGSAGNLVEWFDWYVYSAFGLYFARAFFPSGRPTPRSCCQTAAVFAVGFVMRPIGAWLMGIYADHQGRKAGLTLSVTLMCVGSLLIAVAPTYAQAGLLSPAILLVARIIQGLSLGGEYGSSATYLTEMAGRERRGFWSSFQYVTIIGGQLTALGAAGDAAVAVRRGGDGGLGLAPRLRRRRGAGRRRFLHPPPARRDLELPECRQDCRTGRSRAAATCSATIRARRSW